MGYNASSRYWHINLGKVPVEGNLMLGFISQLQMRLRRSIYDELNEPVCKEIVRFAFKLLFWH